MKVANIAGFIQYANKLVLIILMPWSHCDLKVSRSQAKIDKNFSNYFLKT